MLEKNEFDAMMSIINKKMITQEMLSVLCEKGYVDVDKFVTERGQEILDLYKVENAVIMAAGMSSRFAPLSYEKPKGLLNVKGEILIERQIRQLHEKGIEDITVVVGYKKTQYRYLEEKFGVTIVDNDDYYRYNNTSTLIRVLDKLSNTYICSSDNYFIENVFNTYEFCAMYPTQFHDTYEDGEYYVEKNHEGIITNVTIGVGQECMMGHVYFDRNFSETFKIILLESYDALSVKEMLWEKLYIQHLDKLKMMARLYPENIVMEFDSLKELQAFDKNYLLKTDSKILNSIMKYLACELHEIVDINSIGKTEGDLSFSFTVRDRSYVYYDSRNNSNIVESSSVIYSSGADAGASQKI